MNIKLSFAKNDMANFDYDLTLKKSLGTSFLLYAHCLTLYYRSSYIVSIAKTASEKIGALIHFMKQITAVAMFRK